LIEKACALRIAWRNHQSFQSEEIKAGRPEPAADLNAPVRIVGVERVEGCLALQRREDLVADRQAD